MIDMRNLLRNQMRRCGTAYHNPLKLFAEPISELMRNLLRNLMRNCGTVYCKPLKTLAEPKMVNFSFCGKIRGGMGIRVIHHTPNYRSRFVASSLRLLASHSAG